MAAATQKTSKQILDELHEKMSKIVGSFKTELTKVRTGRASPALLDGLKVDYYGSPMLISQVASVSCPEPRLIQVQPWEAAMLTVIEKSILASDLGLNPQSDGKILRIPLPALTEERRKDIVKNVKKQGEETKVALRNGRRDANEELKKLEKDRALTEDELKKAQDLVQKKTDDFVAEVDKILLAKEKEVLSV